MLEFRSGFSRFKLRAASESYQSSARVACVCFQSAVSSSHSRFSLFLSLSTVSSIHRLRKCRELLHQHSFPVTRGHLFSWVGYFSGFHLCRVETLTLHLAFAALIALTGGFSQVNVFGQLFPISFSEFNDLTQFTAGNQKSLKTF